ncbi:Hsp20/alpha crystallin family protein [Methanobacterium ferruginis]|jgi:HSP20 family protein|uniref:Hsp20/alpha crystallin family protein n=1 Tax=Methanobacterium ferruginis TaxID=710191 RepID=UPI002573FE55|nr:Hsp20/alpha crystallin family protein [Methanobacterium ferruginis]MCC7551298.1 Hsp20/alpha crystallin family protein [Methanobacterium sp.]BDZ66776.1 heat-shock protein Hsp20 [Methanobacterium ferruginis]
MKRKRTILDKKGFVERMMEDTARAIDGISKDIGKSVIDYTFVPGKDILETDESVIVHLDLPGIEKKNIDLDVTETRVRIKANFDIEEEINRGSHLTLHDRKSGVVKRTVRLPKKVIPQEAEAEFKNGVLKVEIPKQEKTESFKVKIR